MSSKRGTTRGCLAGRLLLSADPAAGAIAPLLLFEPVLRMSAMQRHAHIRMTLHCGRSVDQTGAAKVSRGSS
jgi:hypothetical protein